MGRANHAETPACGEMRGGLFAGARQLNATQLAEWILRDRLPVRMQVQLHKLLWSNAPGH